MKRLKNLTSEELFYLLKIKLYKDGEEGSNITSIDIEKDDEEHYRWSFIVHFEEYADERFAIDLQGKVYAKQILYLIDRGYNLSELS